MSSKSNKKTNTKKKNNKIDIDSSLEISKVDNEQDLLEKTLQGLKEESEINPDLENFFEKVKEKKEELENKKDDVIIEEKKQVKPKAKKKSTFGSKFKIFMLILTFIVSIVYYLIYIKKSMNNINYILDITNASLLLLFLFFIILALLGRRKIRNIFSIIGSIIIIGFVSLNILVSKDIIKLDVREVVKDFTNTSITEVMKWASTNNINIETTYEYSDNIDEGNVISQDVKEGTVLKLVKVLNIIVSNGPNYDKELILSNWVGRNVDELIDYINNNHLNNVEITFNTSNDVDKDIIISQNTKGDIKRNTNLSFVVSLGNADSLKAIEINDLTNMKTFDATLYLKRNGIKYETSYEFSDKIKNDYIISQNPTKGTTVSPNSDVVKLVISKGKEIIVPDFSNASVDDVVNWIVENNLKVIFTEVYSTTIDKDKLVSINLTAGTSITEGTKVTIITSKGALTVPTINSLAEFRSWASEYNINYDEKYEYNDNVAKGKIISMSIKSGEKIDATKQSITVTISYGSAVSVPNFVGMTKSNIASTCANKGLNCTYYYVGYNSKAKDTATTQSVSAGSKVISGTYINIGLSSGPAITYRVYINSEIFGNSYNGTVSSLKTFLASNAAGVNFNYVAKSSNSCVDGVIHPDSPIKGGTWNYFTQGNTYTIWVMSC